MMPYDTPLDIARNFLEKLMEDEGLRAEVEGKQPEEVAQIAAEHGFGAGADILMDVLDEYKRRTCAEPAELNPEQLDAVGAELPGLVPVASGALKLAQVDEQRIGAAGQALAHSFSRWDRSSDCPKRTSISPA